MNSLSAPQSPHRTSTNGSDKWQTASCSDLARAEEIKTPLTQAKFTALRHKRNAIGSFLKKHSGEDLSLYLDELRDFAISPGGLVDDEFRSIIWPILADNMVQPVDSSEDACSSVDSDFESNVSEPDEETIDLDIEVLRQHKEWNQVEMDVHRTLARFPPNINETHRVKLQEELVPLIIRVLSINPKYKYYQGFHDVCLTVILVCGSEEALRICSNLARFGCFNGYLTKSLEQSVVKQLDLMYVILSRVEPQVEKVMRHVELGGMFALSWPLTWFSHSLHKYQQIVRFFDVFLASQPLLPIYVASAVVVYRRASILECEREMPFVHRLLSEMPHELPIDTIIKDAVYLARLMPPCLLKTRYYNDYRKLVARPPHATIMGSTIPRYALQFVFVAGTMGAAASFYFIKQFQ